MVMGDMEMKVDLLVLGSCPGGYAAAFRGADLGLDVALVDIPAKPGGLCLYDGCISAKSSMFLAECLENNRIINKTGVHFREPEINFEEIRTWQKKIIADIAADCSALAEKRGIQMIHAAASFENSTTVRLDGGEISRIRFKHAVIALGAGLMTDIPAGIPLHNSRVISPSEVLDLPEIPTSLLVVGGGCVGLELGHFYATIGSRVHLVDKKSYLLSGADQDLVTTLQQALEDRFESIDLETTVLSCTERDGQVTVKLDKNGEIGTYQFDRVLITGPRKMSIDDLRLANTIITMDQTGAVLTDSQQRTAERTIFAVGDICGGATLVHTAILQGKVAAEAAAGLQTGFDVHAIPQVVYTYPQLAWCGLTEKEARDKDIDVKIVKVPWKTNARARSIAATDGLTKLLFNPETGRILGMGVCGKGAEGLISEGVLAIEMGAVAEDLAFILHPHPTLSETLGEAAEIFLGTLTQTIPNKTR